MRVFHLRDDNRKPFATVAINNDDLGVCVCHPTLNTYNKKRGAEIAVGRLDKYGDEGVVPPVKYRTIRFRGKEVSVFDAIQVKLFEIKMGDFPRLTLTTEDSGV